MLTSVVAIQTWKVLWHVSQIMYGSKNRCEKPPLYTWDNKERCEDKQQEHLGQTFNEATSKIVTHLHIISYLWICFKFLWNIKLVYN